MAVLRSHVEGSDEQARRRKQMEALWDDLCRRDAVPVPQWHKAILDQRERLIKKGKARFIDWEIAKKQIRKRIS